MNSVGRKAARWTERHLTACLPEVLSGRADPARSGRHQHSLRDLDSCENGSVAPGPQAAAPLVEVELPPLYDEDTFPVPRRESPLDNGERQKLGLPLLGRPGTRAPFSTVSAPARACKAPHPAHSRPAAPRWPGIEADLLTGICLPKTTDASDLSAEDAERRDVVRRIQLLAGGVRPGDAVLAPALLRACRGGDAGEAKIEAYRWNLSADGDAGYASAYRRERCPVLDLKPTEFVDRCQALSARVAEGARVEVLSWACPEPAPRGPLEAALLELVRRNPGLGERSLAHALAGVGGTQGRVYRMLQRLGLETRAKRRVWNQLTAATNDGDLRNIMAEAARRLAAGDPGLEPLWRYHVAAAWCRLRERLPVPDVPGAGGGTAAPLNTGAVAEPPASETQAVAL